MRFSTPSKIATDMRVAKARIDISDLLCDLSITLSNPEFNKVQEQKLRSRQPVRGI